MKKYMLSVFVIVTLSGAGQNLLLNFSAGDTVLKSKEIEYSSGRWNISLTGKPDWVEFVIFSCGGFDRKLDAGNPQMTWSSTMAQKCAFKVKVKANAAGAGRSWGFDVKGPDNQIIHTVKVSQDAGATISAKTHAGVVGKTADGDLIFSFDGSGGVLRSKETQYKSGRWSMDTSSCPSWIRFVKICSMMGERKLPGGNTSGGKNIYTCSVNGTMEFSFKVMVEPNLSTEKRQWVMPVENENGTLLFNVAIGQDGK